MPDVTILLIKPESVMLFFTVQYNEDIRKNRLSPESSPGQLLHERRTGQVQKRWNATVKTTSSSVFYILNYKLF